MTLLRRRRRCMEREDCIQELLRLVDSMHEMVRAAFYSDPSVEELLGELYRRWEENGREGMPVAHATLEELRLLLGLAEEYSGMPPWKAYRLVEERRLSGGRGGGVD